MSLCWRCGGTSTLFRIAVHCFEDLHLLSQLDTYGHGIDGETLEEALHALYQSRLVHTANEFAQVKVRVVVLLVNDEYLLVRLDAALWRGSELECFKLKLC